MLTCCDWVAEAPAGRKGIGGFRASPKRDSVRSIGVFGREVILRRLVAALPSCLEGGRGAGFVGELCPLMIGIERFDFKSCACVVVGASYRRSGRDSAFRSPLRLGVDGATGMDGDGIAEMDACAACWPSRDSGLLYRETAAPLSETGSRLERTLSCLSCKG